MFFIKFKIGIFACFFMFFFELYTRSSYLKILKIVSTNFFLQNFKNIYANNIIVTSIYYSHITLC
jgi:hypothetical protein